MADTVNLSEIVLPGEGDVVTTTKKRVRVTCDECGEVAVYRQTYLLNGARLNHASQAYGKDDCSWCSDKEVNLCATCKAPRFEGYGECSRFTVGERFKHLFLEWVEVKP